METIIGFVAGYLTGTKDGREGLNRLRTTPRSIAASPETRRIAADATALAGSIAGRGSARGEDGRSHGQDNRPPDHRASIRSERHAALIAAESSASPPGGVVTGPRQAWRRY
jgi:hypothetical protein